MSICQNILIYVVPNQNDIDVICSDRVLLLDIIEIQFIVPPSFVNEVSRFAPNMSSDLKYSEAIIIYVVYDLLQVNFHRESHWKVILKEKKN